MTIKELIKKLQKHPQDKQIILVYPHTIDEYLYVPVNITSEEANKDCVFIEIDEI